MFFIDILFLNVLCFSLPCVTKRTFVLLIVFCSVAELEPVESKLFGDMEPEPKINLKEHFLSQFGGY